jgi:predicted nucleotidyltransferase component of viral defense system
VTRGPVKNIAASVRTRLLHLAQERGEDFQFVLTRYANERLLYRLAASSHAQQFVLKGAALFTVWTGEPHRATRDLDFLGFGDSSEAHIRQVLADVFSTTVPPDGVEFDESSLEVSPIREEQEYAGKRATFTANIDSARVSLQVDVGFGDAITPEASETSFPTLLEFPAPRLRAYPMETVVAEKLEAMVKLGMANSRMKDFYDLVVLSSSFEFDGEILVRAIRATFERRSTPVPPPLPTALTSTFYGDSMKQTQWAAFVRKSGIRDALSLENAVNTIATFIEPPLSALAGDHEFTARWLAGALCL